MTILRVLGRGVKGWVTAWTPRWWTLILMGFTVLSTFTIIQATENVRQDQRIESRCALRGAFFYLADLADGAATAAGREPSTLTAEFRLYLDRTYEPLIPDAECVKYLKN